MRLHGLSGDDSTESNVIANRAVTYFTDAEWEQLKASQFRNWIAGGADMSYLDPLREYYSVIRFFPSDFEGIRGQVSAHDAALVADVQKTADAIFGSAYFRETSARLKEQHSGGFFDSSFGGFLQILANPLRIEALDKPMEQTFDQFERSAPIIIQTVLVAMAVYVTAGAAGFLVAPAGSTVAGATVVGDVVAGGAMIGGEFVAGEVVAGEFIAAEVTGEIIAEEIAAEILAEEIAAEILAEEIAAEILAEEIAAELTIDATIEQLAVETVAESFTEEMAADYLADEVLTEVWADELAGELLPEIIPPATTPGASLPWESWLTKGATGALSLYQQQQARQAAEDQARARAGLMPGSFSPLPGGALQSSGFPLILIAAAGAVALMFITRKGKSRHVSRST